MFVGALLDAGADWEHLKQELQKLRLKDYEISKEKVSQKGLAATLFKVHATEQKQHRNIQNIEKLIKESSLGAKIQKQILSVFWLLAKAEAKVHNCGPTEIHFHEVGAVDAIIDISAACIALGSLAITELYASPIHLGSGEVQCAHGTLPVPVPAVLELLRGIETYSRGIAAELCTPTGAALLKALAAGFGAAPPMRLESIGYGAGEKELPIPNLLRIRLAAASTQLWEQEYLQLLECGIDDMSSEALAYVREKLEEGGAQEVMLISTQMKKGRSAYLLRVLCQPEKAEYMQQILFQESSTLGIRSQSIERLSLARKKIYVTLEHGKVEVKLAYQGEGVCNIAPEYESAKTYALKNSLPLKEVYQMAASKAYADLENITKAWV